MSAPSRADLQLALNDFGLRLRGCWVPAPGEGLPAMPGGRPATVVWMVGVVGSAFWPIFKASIPYRDYVRDGLPDPLDRWSRDIGDKLASRWGGVALYPFDGPPHQPTFHPFQQWASRAEPLQTSPLMLRIHPEFGLWHAYRFALALPECMPGELPSASSPSLTRLPSHDLCLTCHGQPCLSACPVDAYPGHGFKLDACAAHLHTDEGADCMATGCLSRRACPVGQGSRYDPEHAAFHMQAFAGHHGVK